MVGWKLSRHHDAQWVIDALNHAMLQTKRRKTMLFHSDQGSIYGSKQFTQCVQNHKLTQSMSRRGNCWDNAPMERWFRSFKYEWMAYGGYVDFESAVNDVKDYLVQKLLGHKDISVTLGYIEHDVEMLRESVNML